MTLEPLTKTQLGQLRKAESIGFSRSPNACYIIAEKGDNRHRVQVTDRVHERGGYILDEVAFCSYTLHTIGCGYGRAWHTIAAFLKPGDQVMLDWYRDGDTNGYLQDAALHADRLSLVVKRNDKYHEFILASVPSPDNTSRMISVGKNA